mgnify:CR=1 FL=1
MVEFFGKFLGSSWVRAAEAAAFGEMFDHVPALDPSCPHFGQGLIAITFGKAPTFMVLHQGDMPPSG